MKMPLRFRLAAEQDIQEAAYWHERQQAGLGATFIAAIDEAVAAIQANPLRFPEVRRNPEVRRALTKRFPYRIFFIRSNTLISVIRVLHGARDDQAWTSHVDPSSRR